MQKNINVGIHNSFDFVVRDAKTEKVIKEYRAENILLNNFWNGICGGHSARYAMYRYIHFGSGDATPMPTDTALTTYVGYKDAGYPSVDMLDSTDMASGIMKIKKSVRLEEAEHVGETISEIGFASATSTSLNTKALVKDMNGNVISILKEAGVIIDIFATVYFDFSTFLAGDIKAINIGGTTYRNLWGQIVYAIESVNDGGTVGMTPYAQDYTLGLGTAAYTASHSISESAVNKTHTITLTDIAAANGNIGGIRQMTIRDGLGIKLPIAGFAQPVITKEVVGTGDGTRTKFYTKFGYLLNNSTAKVYVNDVETAATIKFNKVRYGETAAAAHFTTISSTGLKMNFPYAWPMDAGKNVIFENPFYNIGFGFASFRGTGLLLSSDDMVTWTTACDASSTRKVWPIPVGHQYKRYYKFEVKIDNAEFIELTSTTTNYFDIELASAPAAESTVAVTYQPDIMAKDTNHVLKNMSVVISYNEYTPS